MPLRVVALDAGRGLALCSDGAGRRETVEIALVAPVAIGDELLVHAGTAIAMLDSYEGNANPVGADAGAQAESPSRRRGEPVAYPAAPGREAEEAAGIYSEQPAG